ncbi:MAG: bifunctional adenosylcobinamide kinase/adenosylcobinamide-phosphate guanylyltransferase [Pseudomonadota bacterium]
MGVSILVTGGARSGKSTLAEGLALRLSPCPIYIATAEALDGEMAARIAAHRESRGAAWQTREVPLDLSDALADTDGGPARLVDCLTLWLSNLLHAGRDPAREGPRLAEAVAAQSAPVVLVTNEVGAGIVPENKLARRFRDEAGRLNQTVAARCDRVYLSVAGHPLQVKPGADIDL